jgi:predicted DsbA family dithiol-disulfide isomerase
MRRVRIDLWTDIVCPWCYIGVTRFERALALRAARGDTGPVDLHVHPFQLDSEAPIPGIPAQERYRQRFGDEAPAILERVTDAAQRDGIEMHFDRALSANTFDAHRALFFAKGVGKERELELRLYRAYFTDGLDISDRDVLASCASEVGIDRDAIATYLASDDGVDAVTQELMRAYEVGITAVPTFVFEGEFAVPGAVDTETFVKIFDQMHAMSGGDA